MDYRPTIISCSRATDAPAFHAKEFAECLKRGFVDKYNSYHESYDRIYFDKCRLIVFWTKNPAPLLPVLPLLDERGIHYYFQYTLNDYGKKIEPHLPTLSKRVDTFKRLSDKLGSDAVVWRYDPILMTDAMGMDWHIDRIRRIHKLLGDSVSRLVFSFIDVENYVRASRNIEASDIRLTNIGPIEMQYFAGRLQALNREMNLYLATCAEKIDLDRYGIEHARCIDDRLIAHLFPEDKVLMRTIGKSEASTDLFGNVTETTSYRKDPNQRALCGCISAKDIGSYNTCAHGCIYCYATSNTSAIKKKPKVLPPLWPVQAEK